MRAALALPEGQPDKDPRFRRVVARSSALGPAIDVELNYGLQGPEQLDLFHLSVTR